jgi:hypothetical protein
MNSLHLQHTLHPDDRSSGGGIDWGNNPVEHKHVGRQRDLPQQRSPPLISPGMASDNNSNNNLEQKQRTNTGPIQALAIIVADTASFVRFAILGRTPKSDSHQSHEY